MNPIVLWSLPPLAGAVIGYVTNAIAIKMLFRPHRAIRIFGVRLPFTPGILPRQRHKLADSIGAMVERELLTPEIIRARLMREDTRESVRAAVAGYTEGFFNLSLDKLSPGRNEFFFFITETLRDFVKTPAFEDILGRFLNALIDNQEAQGGDLQGPPIRDILGSEESEQWVKILERTIRKAMLSLAARIPGDLPPILDRNFPRLREVFLHFLNRPEIHRALETQGRLFLNNAIFKLNAVQRFFISAGQYDKTLRERMPEIIDDLIDQLEDLLGEQDIHERLRSYTTASIQGILMAEAVSAELSPLVSGWIEAILARSPGELLAAGDREAPGRFLHRILTFLTAQRAENSKGAFGRAFSAFAGEHRDLKMGELLSIPPERKDALDSLLCDTLLVLADKEIDAVLGTIKIRTLVSDRIDSLDMIDVEHIILDIMSNQLKWINFFGAILGALLGLFQSVFSWIVRGS
ncbi:MAG: DUF445 family protein [Spirochaetaceae bacterium]|jgi:hypothetical protein|nr:DUF445 family protein [Spirochaetaceae bacterium]